MFKGLFNKVKKAGNKGILEFPLDSESQKTHFEAVLACPKMRFTLKFLCSDTAMLDCIAEMEDITEREGAKKAFEYIQARIKENLQSHPKVLE